MARRKAKNGGGEAHGGVGHGTGTMRWLFSYSDLLTLMFVFFVILYSMAQVDAKKYADLAGSLRRSLGGPPVAPPLPVGGHTSLGPAQPLVPPDSSGPEAGPGPTLSAPDWVAAVATNPEPAPAPVPAVPPAPEPPPPPKPEPAPPPPAPPPPPPPPAPAPEDVRLQNLATAVRGVAWPRSNQGAVEIRVNDRGLLISLAGSVIFEAGQDAIRPEAMPALEQIARYIQGAGGTVVVESTADDAPAGVSNFALASSRGNNLISLFMGKGMAPEQFVLVGYGVQRSPGAAESGRRVDIVVLRRKS